MKIIIFLLTSVFFVNSALSEITRADMICTMSRVESDDLVNDVIKHTGKRPNEINLTYTYKFPMALLLDNKDVECSLRFEKKSLENSVSCELKGVPINLINGKGYEFILNKTNGSNWTLLEKTTQNKWNIQIVLKNDITIQILIVRM